MANIMVPVLSPEGGLARYLREISRFPMLTVQEEYTLAKRWQEEADLEAAHALVTSHLRLVAKIAMQYRGYGLPVADLIAEGNIGLMHAVKKFDPELGHRLSTYALWWIRASMQDYILKSWSMVKIGTSSMRKSLFFNLRKIKSKLLALEGKADINDDVENIAKMLNVSRYDVMDMDVRLSQGDASLDEPLGEGESALGDTLAALGDGHEVKMIAQNEHDHKMRLLYQGMSNLTEREKDIVKERLLKEPAMTLDVLSQKYGVSRERIRQIEEKAMQKLRQFVSNMDPDQKVN